MHNRVLVVDNEKKMCNLIKMALELEGIPCDTASSGKEAFSILTTKKTFDIIISDLKMSPVDGLSLLKEIKRENPATEFIIMTAYASQETALEAMKEGAQDYIIKPFNIDELVIRVKRLMGQMAIREENLLLKEAKEAQISYEGIVGKSAAMQEMYKLIEKIKNTEATVMIIGESGTGKELVARLLHEQSNRKQEAFVEVNCAAIPEKLLESELFGYEKGAFTGAVNSKPGKFELADKGTIFLDEIGELNPDTQAKLLKVLEDKSFYRVGGVKKISVDVRIIAATNRNLREMTEEGTFREDLYYRLMLFPITIPALRERKEDIPELVWFFLQNSDKMVNSEAMQMLMRYDWPGNVRQLQNSLYRAAIIAEKEITVKELPKEIVQQAERAAPEPRSEISLNDRNNAIPPEFSLDDFEKQLIEQSLVQAGGNKSRAAGLLGITRRRLYSLMEKHKITLKSDAE